MWDTTWRFNVSHDLIPRGGHFFQYLEKCILITSHLGHRRGVRSYSFLPWAILDELSSVIEILLLIRGFCLCRVWKAVGLCCTTCDSEATWDRPQTHMASTYKLRERVSSKPVGTQASHNQRSLLWGVLRWPLSASHFRACGNRQSYFLVW